MLMVRAVVAGGCTVGQLNEKTRMLKQTSFCKLSEHPNLFLWQVRA